MENQNNKNAFMQDVENKINELDSIHFSDSSLHRGLIVIAVDQDDTDDDGDKCTSCTICAYGNHGSLIEGLGRFIGAKEHAAFVAPTLAIHVSKFLLESTGKSVDAHLAQAKKD